MSDSPQGSKTEIFCLMGKPCHEINIMLIGGALAYQHHPVHSRTWWLTLHNDIFRQTIERDATYCSIYCTPEVIDIYGSEVNALVAVVEGIKNGKFKRKYRLD